MRTAKTDDLRGHLLLMPSKPLIVLFLLCTFALPLHAQSPAAADIADLIYKLRSFKIDEEFAEITPTAIPALTALKRALPNLVLQHLNALPNSVSLSADLEQAVAQDLSGSAAAFARNDTPLLVQTLAGPFPVTSSAQSPVFSLNAMLAVPIPGHPELLSVVVTLLVPCGEDEAFYLFKRGKDAWALSLVQQGYSSLDGDRMQENFSAQFMDEPGASAPTIITASNPPWCTSNWSGLQVAAWRPGPDPFAPLKVGAAVLSYRRSDGYRMTVEGGSIKVRYRGNETHDDWLGYFPELIDKFQIIQGKWSPVTKTADLDAATKARANVHIYYQSDAFQDEAQKMAEALKQSGYQASAQLEGRRQDTAWANCIRYFHPNDDELAIRIQGLLFDIFAAKGYVNTVDSSPEIKGAAIPEGWVDIWLCDESANEQVEPDLPPAP